MVKVKIPASSANMGTGFDALGVALNLYSRLEVEETPGGLEINTLNAAGFVPKDETNLIYKAMCPIRFIFCRKCITAVTVKNNIICITQSECLREWKQVLQRTI